MEYTHDIIIAALFNLVDGYPDFENPIEHRHYKTWEQATQGHQELIKKYDPPMKCLVCQKELEQLGSGAGIVYYCPEMIAFNNSYRIPHFSSYYSHKTQPLLLVTEVASPPFVILRVENGVLEVQYLTFTTRPVGSVGTLNITHNPVITVENTQPDDLLKYVDRFQKLKAFS